MGWPSYAEDIEKRRQDTLHMLDGLIASVREELTPTQLEWEKSDIGRLRERIVSQIESLKRDAQEVFERALHIARDPDVRITSKMDKLQSERDAAIKARNTLEVERDKARDGRERAEKRVAELENDVSKLSERLLRFEANLPFYEAMADVTPLRRS